MCLGVGVICVVTRLTASWYFNRGWVGVVGLRRLSVVRICGGLPKSDDLDECAPNFGNVAAAYTIGEAGPRFAEILEPVMPVERCEMLCEAVSRAIAAAKPGHVVLFSPACASFDQFRDYEQRGDSFRKLVAELTGATERESAAFTAKSAA